MREVTPSFTPNFGGDHWSKHFNLSGCMMNRFHYWYFICIVEFLNYNITGYQWMMWIDLDGRQVNSFVKSEHYWARLFALPIFLPSPQRYFAIWRNRPKNGQINHLWTIISQTRMRQPLRAGTNLLLDHFCSKNCMKMKKCWPGGVPFGPRSD